MLYVIKSQKMMAHLILLGHQLVKMDIDKANPNMNVFLFRDTPKLREDMATYKK